MMPQIGLVTAEGGTSFLPVTGTKVSFYSSEFSVSVADMGLHTPGFSFTATHCSCLWTSTQKGQLLLSEEKTSSSQRSDGDS